MPSRRHVSDDLLTLTADEIARLRCRFEQFDGRLFDLKIARDAESGKLDRLAEAARGDAESCEFSR